MEVKRQREDVVALFRHHRSVQNFGLMDAALLFDFFGGILPTITLHEGWTMASTSSYPITLGSTLKRKDDGRNTSRENPSSFVSMKCE
jgi:hypothetical protein